ncbi:MAG: nitrate reductase, partial [Pseudomonadota bacterium]
MSGTRTTCPYCGVGCGVIATADGTGGAAIAGDRDHPANFGRLCSKGSALGETLGLEGRLLYPQVGGIQQSWDTALDLVAGRFQRTIAEHGPDSVAFYVSGQLLTEDYYVANKLMKGFIGSANIDTNSRLCMASSVAGHKRAFGTDTVPGTYEDLEEAELILLVGSNLAWCHPVLHQRIMAAGRATIVTIDPRRTATAETGDIHLGLRPGTDVTFFNGLLRHFRAMGALDQAYMAKHVNGVDDAFAAVDGATIPHVAEVCGLDQNQVERVFAAFARTEKVVTVYSQGVNQAVDGTDRVNAILNCHLATGRIGRPGMGPFSVTGQPNAMGGREVGGLANMLAAHLDIENGAHRDAVRMFWDAPTMAERPGLKAVEMFDACASGQIKALWIMCTNPAVSLPRADAVADAIRACDFTVVSDIMARTDTTECADVLLPATGWGEKDGTVTNSERRISRQRAFLPAPGEARHDWDIMSDVARRMDFEGFDYQSPAEIFREYAALTGIAQRFGRDLTLEGLADVSAAEYDRLDPVQWPVPAGAEPGGRFFADGGFFTQDRKARMLPVTQTELPEADETHPFLLNTGRVRDHWHTMTRTATSPTLSQHIAEPFVEVHPKDAEALGLDDATLAEVKSPHGRIVARVRVTDRVARGSVFVPMHWTGQWTAQGRVDAVVDARRDPISGQPALKSSRVALAPFSPRWFAFGISVSEPQPDCAYWAKAKVPGGWRIELAGDADVVDWEDSARALFAVPDLTPITVMDRARGTARLAYVDEGRVTAALFVAPEPVQAARAYLSGALGPDLAAASVLAGRPGQDRPDPGAHRKIGVEGKRVVVG